MSDETVGKLKPLWDYDRMGQECAKNATKRNSTPKRPTMDEIVKYAYETTMFAMRDEYEATIATQAAEIDRLRAELAKARKPLQVLPEQHVALDSVAPFGQEGGE